MAGLQALEFNAYDILGVSPGASPEEIERAYQWLIKEGGYRQGVPLHGQWQRARAIKEAYATLADPSSRQAYDDSLGVVEERPLWPAAANDQRPDPQARPLDEWQPPRTAPVAVAGAAGWDEEEPANRSARLWGGAAVAALALGGLLYFAWPDGEVQGPGGEASAGGQVASRTLPAVPVAGLPTEVAADAVGAEVPPEAPGEVPPMPEALDAFFVAPGAAPAAGSATAPTKVAIAEQAQPGAAATTEGSAAATPATAPPAPPTGQPASQAQAQAAVAQPGTPPPAPVQARPVAASTVRSDPQWISGGPTAADNRRGKYSGNVVVQFNVTPEGRVGECGAVKSSGNGALDALTCRLIQERARFKPALDAKGNPIAGTAHARYEWGKRRRDRSLLSSIF